MISEDGRHILCEESVNGCEARIANDRWRKIKEGENWAFTRGDVTRREKAFCPDHIPDWYDPWKRRKEQEKLQPKKSYRKAKGL